MGVGSSVTGSLLPPQPIMVIAAIAKHNIFILIFFISSEL